MPHTTILEVWSGTVTVGSDGAGEAHLAGHGWTVHEARRSDHANNAVDVVAVRATTIREAAHRA